MLATGRLIGEGFDHPPLDTLVLAMPISWKGTLQQYAGRLHREHADKQESIAHLNQAEQEAQKAFDWALEKIEEFVSKPPVKPGTTGEGPAVKPPVAIKPRCIVNAAKLAGSAYLETPDDIEKFLRELRQRLEEAIKTGKRVQIR